MGSFFSSFVNIISVPGSIIGLLTLYGAFSRFLLPSFRYQDFHDRLQVTRDAYASLWPSPPTESGTTAFKVWGEIQKLQEDEEYYGMRYRQRLLVVMILLQLYDFVLCHWIILWYLAHTADQLTARINALIDGNEQRTTPSAASPVPVEALYAPVLTHSMTPPRRRATISVRSSAAERQPLMGVKDEDNASLHSAGGSSPASSSSHYTAGGEGGGLSPRSVNSGRYKALLNLLLQKKRMDLQDIVWDDPVRQGHPHTPLWTISARLPFDTYDFIAESAQYSKVGDAKEEVCRILYERLCQVLRQE